MTVKALALVLPLFLLFFACKNEQAPSSPAETAGVEPELPAGFTEFYQKFHTDSLYQMAHIVFPLEGLPNKADSTVIADNSFRWTEADWRMQHQVDFSMSEFKREIVPLTSSLVVERIYDEQHGFGMLRKFAIVGDGEWHLIYYAGMNRMATK